MTGQQMKESMEYRGKMNAYLQSGVVCEAGQDWIRMELHNQQRELQGEVAGDLRQERKSARVAARAQRIRSRLKNLLFFILPRTEEKRNA